MKNVKLIAILCILTTSIIAQRKSLSVVVLNDGGDYVEIIKENSNKSLKSTTTYDGNIIEYNTPFESYLDPSSYSVANALVKSKVGNNIMAHWWNRQPDGSFLTNIVAERGKYSATDNDVQLSAASQRGLSKIEDAGEQLIQHSYVLAIKVTKVLDQEEVYDRLDEKLKKVYDGAVLGVKLIQAFSKAANKEEANKEKPEYKPLERVLKGYELQFQGRLFQLVYDEKAKQDFYKMWPYKEDSQQTRQAKIAAFDNYSFQFKEVGFFDEKAVSTAKIIPDENQRDYTMEELYAKAVGYINSIAISHFNGSTLNKAESSIYSLKPIIIKVGTKEGVGDNDRFFVYENVQKSNGQVDKIYKGAIRVQPGSVMSNSKNADGNGTGTQFYRVHGIAKLDKGMYIKEQNDRGQNFYYSATVDPKSNNYWNIGWDDTRGKNLGVGMNITMVYGQKKAPIESNYGIEVKDLYELSFYCRKEFYPLNNIKFSLMAGGGFAMLGWKNTEIALLGLNLPIAGEIGYSIRPSFGLFANISKNILNLPLKYKDFSIEDSKLEFLLDDGGKMIKWLDLAPTIAAPRLQFGLRVSI